jgi:hypothetical protein
MDPLHLLDLLASLITIGTGGLAGFSVINRRRRERRSGLPVVIIITSAATIILGSTPLDLPILQALGVAVNASVVPNPVAIVAGQLVLLTITIGASALDINNRLGFDADPLSLLVGRNILVQVRDEIQPERRAFIGKLRRFDATTIGVAVKLDQYVVIPRSSLESITALAPRGSL